MSNDLSCSELADEMDAHLRDRVLTRWRKESKHASWSWLASTLVAGVTGDGQNRLLAMRGPPGSRYRSRDANWITVVDSS
ncbi:MAG: hypothetical protein HN742_22850 [Lentisphaerae bacterium]|jgi:hypothetical protein|nr:hypothetical protein [Lentisphaerota bacterium]MBT4823431.1 hypothetical protein [Lentisphaerota bacterium]MBT5606199.1 hypothetical protein [Lentisphaerota bacterium]MBT7060411.1 hypothetical protein [Lentisphaerota bacterium]MBT7844735.1 hypothetical protein [Lentisphaerota bacterium]